MHVIVAVAVVVYVPFPVDVNVNEVLFEVEMVVLTVSEIRGLKWEYIGEGQIFVLGNFWKGHEVSPKTTAR